MSKELLLTALLPRHVHYTIALSRSFETDGMKDNKLVSMIKGGGMGAYNELVGDGLKEIAQDVIVYEREKK